MLTTVRAPRGSTTGIVATTKNAWHLRRGNGDSRRYWLTTVSLRTKSVPGDYDKRLRDVRRRRGLTHDALAHALAPRVIRSHRIVWSSCIARRQRHLDRDGLQATSWVVMSALPLSGAHLGESSMIAAPRGCEEG